MAQARLCPVVRQLRHLAGAAPLSELTDAELLQRFLSTSTAEDRAGKLQFEGTVAQALMMMHSDFTNKAIKDGVARLKKKNMGDNVYIFAATLGRPPSPLEAQAFSMYGADLETCMWILMNSAEFVTIH